ncbi:hypothetical protein N7494_012054 [Penicillium frequentans]|uniref:Zn(2)-C6 fungal-type domain-containing protein n=1 Tax=Penicillium frequentans TaxID=3151616 RepID=A0AAD6CNI6_9EURO|nr:hypothetical protein N7494_012054 [Penicillium glabrum]
MSTLSSSLIFQANSILACTHCARSKAKCDRKVPCSRCIQKKIFCQVRVPQRGPQRGPNRSSLNYKPKEPTSISSNPSKDSDATRAEPVNDSATNGDHGTTAPLYPTGSGIYMDWNHSAANMPQLTMSQKALEEDPLASLIATVSGADETYTSNISLSSGFIQQGPLCSNDPSDFAFPTRELLPTTQKTSLTDLGMAPWSLPFTVQSEALPNMADEDEAMENYVPTIPSYTTLEDGNSDLDQLETLEGWPLFQCNPVMPSSTCVPTAAKHVDNMHSLLRHNNMIVHNSQPVACNIVAEPLLASTREKLSAVMQGFYNEAQELYELRGSDNRIPGYSGGSILVLPPPSVIEVLLRSYLCCCEPYYPFIPIASLNINERLKGRNTILPSMLLLLMFAAGAMAAKANETYSKFAHGLVEICRISLRNVIEKNIKLASDHEVSQCALLNIIVSAWSGDKWQMDIAHYQKSMFLEMHLKAEQHYHRETQVARLESSNDVAHSWEIWKAQEGANRLTHCWLIVDHEISLFRDTLSTSVLSTTNFNTPIPSPDSIWSAKFAKTWIEMMLSAYGRVSMPPSLNDWLYWFSETNEFRSTAHISPITMRLLLCHLQDQIMQLRSNIDRALGRGQTHKCSQHLSVVLFAVQVQEAQEQLHKWHDLTKTQIPNETAFPETATNMILYHLIMLNTMVNFPAIELLARSNHKSEVGNNPPRRCSQYAHHLEDTTEIYFHCGQVMRQVRSIPEPTRPPWWAGAIYRVALIAWANGLVSTDVANSSHRGDTGTQGRVLLDVLPPSHPSIISYLNHRGGIPAFSDSDNTAVHLDDSVDVIRHCASFLDTEIKTKFTLGIRQKLLTMATRWENGNP